MSRDCEYTRSLSLFCWTFSKKFSRAMFHPKNIPLAFVPVSRVDVKRRRRKSADFHGNRQPPNINDARSNPRGDHLALWTLIDGNAVCTRSYNVLELGRTMCWSSRANKIFVNLHSFERGFCHRKRFSSSSTSTTTIKNKTRNFLLLRNCREIRDARRRNLFRDMP